MRVKNHAESPRICRRNRSAERFVGGEFFPNALVNQHVGIHRHADAEHDTGDAGEGEGELEHRQHADGNQNIQH